MRPGLLEDLVCLVTGGGRGIGRAIACAFAEEGARVLIGFCRSEASAAETARAIVEAGGEAATTRMDVAQPGAAEEAVRLCRERWGRLDVLVNNAGVIRDAMLARMDEEAWSAVIETNVTGAARCVRAAARLMIPQRSGSIINVSSVAARRPNAGQSNYAASKGAIDAFTRAMAVELAPRRIRVNALAPGFVETDMAAAVLNRRRDEIEGEIPLRRIGRPDDIAGAAVFLASNLSGYVTGQVLTVDGGMAL